MSDSTRTPGRSKSLSSGAERTTVTFVTEGQTLSDRYHLVREIAAGGMGIVYEGRDRTLDDRRVAIKVLPPELSRSKAARKRLKKEALAALELTHRNVMRLHSFEEDDGVVYLVMEYLEGENLEELLAERDHLPLDEVLEIARHAVAGLAEAHRKNVIHRDIKPANLQRARDGAEWIIKITDFGIAAQVKDSMTRLTGVESSGTILYAPPEQLRGRTPDARSDQYSLAATLYELLRGRPPFQGVGLSYQIENADPEEIEDVPAHVNAALRHALAKTPEERFPDVETFLDALDGGELPVTFGAAEDGEAAEDDGDGDGEAAAPVKSTSVPPSRSSPQEPEGPEAAPDARERPASTEAPRSRERESGAALPRILGCLLFLGLLGSGAAAALLFATGVADEVLPGFFASLEVAEAPGIPDPPAADEVPGEPEPPIPEIAEPAAAPTYHPPSSGQQAAPWAPPPADVLEAAPWSPPPAVSPVAEPPPPSPVMGEIGFELLPAGSKVFRRDGTLLCTPNPTCVLELPVGTHRLSFVSEGFQKLVRTFEVDADGNHGTVVTLEPLHEEDLDSVSWKIYGGSAMRGSTEDQVRLGLAYENGDGIRRDLQAAAAWYRRAAKQEDATGQAYLGDMYEHGKGVGRDLGEAFRLYRLAAGQRNDFARFRLAKLYRDGRGTARDAGEAARLFRLVAETGDPDAQAALGQLYRTGAGVELDLGEALRWFRRAAKQGNALGQLRLGQLCEKGEGLDENQVEATRLYQLAAEQGNARAQDELGDQYYYGRGIPQDRTEAAAWFRKAAEQGLASGQYDYGWVLYQGQGVAKDEAGGAEYLRKAAAQGDERARRAVEKFGL